MNTFSKQPEVQQKALQKALKSPYIGRHGKRRSTLLKEEIYKEIIEECRYKLAEALSQITPVLIDLAASGDVRAIKEIYNRVLGKVKEPPEIIEPVVVPEETRARMKKLFKQLL